MTENVEVERELRRQIAALQAVAPNPRDYRRWDDFYIAQREHEATLAALEQRIPDPF